MQIKYSKKKKTFEPKRNKPFVCDMGIMETKEFNRYISVLKFKKKIFFVRILLS